MANKAYDNEDNDESFFERVEAESEASNKRKREFMDSGEGGQISSDPSSGKTLSEEEHKDYMQQVNDRAGEETEALNSYFSGLNSEDKQKPKGPAQKARMALRKRRNKILIGAIGTVVPFVTGFITLPYQLVNLSSLLQQFHFSIGEDVGTSRTTKIIRYIRYNGEPDAAARRRLSIIGNKLATRVETKLGALGMDVNYSAGGFLETVDVDLTNRALINDLTADGLEIDRANSPDGKTRFRLEPAGSVDPSVRRQNFRSIVRRPGYTKLSSLGTRRLIRKGGITMRPMGLLSRSLRDDRATRIRAWKDDRTERRVNGVREQPIARTGNPGEDATPEEIEERNRAADIEADETERRRATGGDTPGDRIASARSRILGGAVAGVAGVGLLCTIRQLDAQADELKWINRALPKMRMGMDLIAAGDQIKTGEGFTAEEVGVWTEEVQELAQLAVEKDSNGEVIFADLGPAINAEGIRSELDLPGGDPQQDSGRYSETNNLLDRLSSLGGWIPEDVCSVATNPWFGAAVTIATLGTASFADWAIDGAVLAAGALWIDDLIRIAAGVEVNPEAVGSELGNHANDGARLAANGQAIAEGGRALTFSENLAWEDRRDQLIAEENAQKPFMERYFSLTNPRSLASMSIMRIPQGYGSSITDLFTSPFTAMAGIFSPVHAQGDYDYGFPRFGFSIGELENIDYENPFENENILESLADIDELHETVGRDCFELDISEDGNGGTFGTLEGNYYFGDEGLLQKCAEARGNIGDACTGVCNENEVFTRYRFYVLDTQLLTAMACYEGLETFCEELGFGSTASNPGVNVEGAIVGNPYESSVDIACDPRTVDIGVGEGFVQQTLTPMRLCAVPNIPSVADESTPGNRFYVEGSNGSSIVNSRVSGAWFALGESARLDGINLSAQSTFRTQEKQEDLWVRYGMNTSRVARPGNSPHQAGAAIDITMSGGTRYIQGAQCSNPATSTDPAYIWLTENAYRFGFGQYAAEAWHWDPSTAANRCRFAGV